MTNQTHHVAIVGAGLAGLAAASALGLRGYRVTLLEARLRTGGRASSFVDSTTGQVIDACQHVSMGCCTNLAHFCRTVGVDHLVAPQPWLYFMTPDRRVSRFGVDQAFGLWGWLPARPVPLHLASSFLRAHYLSVTEKLRIAWGLFRLKSTKRTDDPPFLQWLQQHGQTPRTIDRFWGLVLVSALNESIERIGFRYARKVFVDAFLRHRKGFQVEIPTVPLGDLYGSALLGWLAHHGIELRLGEGVRRILIDSDQGVPVCRGLELRNGSTLVADHYVTAIPQDRLLDLLPSQCVEQEPSFSQLRQLQTSPIVSVHLWYDRPLTDLPHVVLIDCLSQWVFNQGKTPAGEYYFRVVVSAARELRRVTETEEIEQRIVAELADLFPAAHSARLLHSRVITEHGATFSVVPGVDRWRPQAASPVGNLYLAGDWTATGWPATMEGAVRSGYLAAEALLDRQGQKEQLVQPDL